MICAKSYPAHRFTAKLIEIDPRGSQKNHVKNTRKLSRDMWRVPFDRYRLPDDGRNWRYLCGERQRLAEWLAVPADSDGSNVYPAVETMMAHFGWSHGKVHYILNDLKRLNLLEDDNKTTDSKWHRFGQRRTRKRKMNFAAFTGEDHVTNNQSSSTSNLADPPSNIAATTSNAELYTTETPPITENPSLADWIPLDAFMRFKEMRRQKGKPLTANVIPAFVERLAVLKAGGNDLLGKYSTDPVAITGWTYSR